MFYTTPKLRCRDPSYDEKKARIGAKGYPKGEHKKKHMPHDGVVMFKTAQYQVHGQMSSSYRIPMKLVVLETTAVPVDMYRVRLL